MPSISAILATCRWIILEVQSWEALSVHAARTPDMFEQLNENRLIEKANEATTSVHENKSRICDTVR